MYVCWRPLALSLLSIVVGLHASNGSALAVTRVDLKIDEPFADRTAAWPITTGVPFPRGKLTSADHCRLVDDRGQERPLQARVAATWDAECKSVRWLTIDFVAEPGRRYTLEFGDDVARGKLASNLAVEQDKAVRISTGAVTAEFSATGPAALRRVAADLDGNGKVTAEEVVAAGATEGEHYYVNQAGQRFSSAHDGADRRVVVESTGPVRACIRVDGFYTRPGGERIAKYRTRYHFFAGLPLVKVVDEFGLVGSTKETRFADLGFALDLKIKTAGRSVVADASGEPGNQPLEVPWQEDTQGVAAFQKTFRHYGNVEHEAAVVRKSAKEEQKLAEPERMGEWLQVADDKSAVTGSLRWFWEQFPKEWEATPNQLVLHLWSPRGGELDFGSAGIEKFFGPGGAKYLRGGHEKHDSNPLDRFFFQAEVSAIARGAADGLGLNKHHEFFLHFAPAGRRADGAEYGRLAARQPLALASGEWNCSTDVFGPLAARPNDSLYEAAVDRIFDLSREMQHEFGDYGWWLFGAGPHYSYQWDAAAKRFVADSRRFEYHTYHKETQLWWNYLRSGERKFYDWAIPSENHWVDVAVSHAPTAIDCGWRGGEPAERRLHWRPGDWSIDSPTHYVRHHDTAEAWLRGGAQFWASYHRTLETTTLAYYLTGDERYNDVVEYWRTYFGELAGQTSASADIRPWYHEQAWYRPTAPGERAKTWAEMIRDYAPFHSGTRHQMTMFFNLATLYEHTWDPLVGQALRECAAAFLDPPHPIGTWRAQDAGLPAHADAPSMGHFWVPALWKYSRASGDPRMPDILARYFAAGYAADPFREHESVGVYSNAYLGYAYYFTRDPRFLPLVEKELEGLLPYAKPLARPEEMNARLYNPYAPARTFAGVPRLTWALQSARREGVRIAPRPLPPQRMRMALHKLEGVELTATLWGFDSTLTVIGPDARLAENLSVKTQKFASEIQPFDRVMPQFEVYLHQFTIPAAAPVGTYLLAPTLELAALDWNSKSPPLWNAYLTLALKPGEAVLLPVPKDARTLLLESAQAAQLRLRDASGAERTGKVTGNMAEFALDDISSGLARIEMTGSGGWFRIESLLPTDCWVMPAGNFVAGGGPDPKMAAAEFVAPDQKVTSARYPTQPFIDPEKTIVPGLFGKSVQIAPQRALHIPDRIVEEGVEWPLFSEKQGTIEFWVRQQSDPRRQVIPPASLLTNGLVTVPHLPRLKYGEWTHVAYVWAPYKGDPKQLVAYTYIDGRDSAFYRSFHWEGYGGAHLSSGPGTAKGLLEFVARAAAGTSYSIDELRISSVPRYADLMVQYGPQQTYNPVRFEPPTEPFKPDPQTLLLFHFDDDLKAAVPEKLPAARVGE